MWNNFIGQVQKRLDDAVDLLKEDVDEDEEYEEEEEDWRRSSSALDRNEASTTAPSTLLPLTKALSRARARATPHTASPLAPAGGRAGPPTAFVPQTEPRPAEVTDDTNLSTTQATHPEPASTHTLAHSEEKATPVAGDGWSEEDDDGEDASATEPRGGAHTSGAVAPAPPLATAVDVLPAAQPAASQTGEPEALELHGGAVATTSPAAESEAPGVGTTERVAEAASETAPVLREEVVVGDQSGAKTPDPEAMESSLAPVESREEEATAVPAPVTSPPPPTPSTTTTTTNATITPAPPPQAAATASPEAPSLPSSSAVDVEQLLRFQQQLAAEMERSSALSEENESLKRRLAIAEREAAAARKQVSEFSNAEAELSTLIERLGREKERSKTISEERKVLRERVRTLEQQLEEYQVKESAWQHGQQEQQQERGNAQQYIIRLEEEANRRVAQIDDLERKLTEAQHAKEVLTGQLQEAQRTHQERVEALEENSSGTVEHLQREVARLKESLQRTTAEYDERSSELERELSQANRRAHQAELRLSDLEHGSVGALRDLRSELEDMQSRVVSLTTELNAAREEHGELLEQYGALKRARLADEANYKERVLAQGALVATVKEERLAVERECAGLRQRLQTALQEAEDAKKKAQTAEASLAQMKSSLEEARRTPDDSGAATPLVHSGSGVHLQRPSLYTPADVSSSRVGRAAPPVNPFLFTERDRPGLDTTDNKTRVRLEKEILRQSVELERLKKVEVEAAQTKKKLVELSAQHDILLQMFGQLEEEARQREQEAQAKASPAEGGAPTNEKPAT